jgi:predicted phage tail protein
LITTSATASPSTESDPEDEFIRLLTKNFYDSMEGCLSLLFKSKKTPFSVLKASLLHCIESIRTVGGPGSVAALEKVMADFERDVEAWQATRHAELFPKADAEFQRLSGHLLKLREEEMLQVKALEQDLEAIKATAELVADELETVQQATNTTHKQIVAARQMIEKANAILARAEPVYSANLQRQTELTERSISLVKDEAAKASELEGAKARLANTLAFAEGDLRKQALATVEEERRRELSALELKLKSYVNR